MGPTHKEAEQNLGPAYGQTLRNANVESDCGNFFFLPRFNELIYHIYVTNL